MNGRSEKLFAFMEGKDNRFLIPVFQRKYSWKVDNCRQLYNDLKSVIVSKKSAHFFGSIVLSRPTGSAETEFLIIDGQQRLTTVTLMLLAMYNLLHDNQIRASKACLADEILNTYLIDPYTQDSDKIKLRPVKEDEEALKKLYDADPSKFIKGSRITSNYLYFCDAIRNAEVSVDELYEAFKKLEIIRITLSDEDDAQLIFESLNSTGMELSEGDKIRNFILMGLSSEEQNHNYNTYWTKIEKLTGDDISSFARDYLTVKQQITPAIKNVYRDFKDYATKQSIPTEDLLKDLLNYANHYNKLMTCNSEMNNRELDKCMYRLKRLDISVIRPFMMTILDLASKNILSSDEVLQIFSVVETYLFRRNICNIPSNALNKIFQVLDKEVQRYDGTTDNYVQKFIYTIESKTGTGRFPGDKEFIDWLSTKDVYLMSGTFKKYLFERYEGFMGVGEIDVYSLLDSGHYSIEHIMPQTLSPEWEESLGEDHDAIHDAWQHRLANLTLIVHNSDLQNHSFSDKLNDPVGGYKKSGFWMNKWIAEQNTWGLHELEERNNLLCDKALEVWKYPETEFVPEKPNDEICTLADEDVELTGRGIYKYFFQNNEHLVSSWTDMFLAVVKELNDKDNSILMSLASHLGDDVYLEKYFSFNAADLRTPVSIDNQFFVECNTSTLFKTTLLRRLFEKYEKSPDDLYFYLQEKTYTTKDISSLIRKWASDNHNIEADIAHSDYTYTRFLTQTVRRLFPSAGNELSAWKTQNHYFYEIVIENTDEIYIKLELNSKNASADFIRFCKLLHDLYPIDNMGPRWKYCMIFKTKSFNIGNTLSKDLIYSGLDECMDELMAFERELEAKLESIHTI